MLLYNIYSLEVMKKQIVNEKVFRNYLNLHKIDENFEAFLEDHKPA